MKKLLLALFLFAGAASAQTPALVRFGPTLPATCSPTAKRAVLFYKIGTANGLYQCLTANTWTAGATGATQTIGSGTAVMATGAITSATCATAVTVVATGVLTTDAIIWGFNSDPTGVTGYTPVTTGALTIFAYPTSGNVNFKVCNLTSASVTPGALTLNWRVAR